MFIGHYAVGFASKRVAPRVSLAWFVAGATLLDLLFPLFVLLGWENARFVPADTPFLRISLDNYPWTHSLLMAVVWSVGFALLCWAVTRARGAALVAGAAVFSHWVLDFITHRPDMPLLPGRRGAGRPRALVLDGGHDRGRGAAVRRRRLALREDDARPGRRRPLGVVGAGRLPGAVLRGGPRRHRRRRTPELFAWVGCVFGWLLVAWAWWIDKHRDVRVRGEK